MQKKKFGNGKGVMTFSERVVALARMIPAGRVTTYGRIAQAAGGGSMASRSITSILAKAYASGVTDIPFHRIVYADGRVWMDSEYREKRGELYRNEKIQIDKKERVVNFGKTLFEFPAHQ